jgi:hypothetical protein
MYVVIVSVRKLGYYDYPRRPQNPKKCQSEKKVFVVVCLATGLEMSGRVHGSSSDLKPRAS